MNLYAGEYIEFFGDTDSVMKEYAFLPASQLDPLRDQFLPSKVAKKLQCCIEGARKEKLEINSVIEVRTYSVVSLVAAMFSLPVLNAHVLSYYVVFKSDITYCEDLINVCTVHHFIAYHSISCLSSYEVL